MSAPAKGMAVASLVLGVLGLPTFGLLGIGALVGLILGIIALVRANQRPREYGGKGLAIGGIITNVLSLALVPIIGMIAAIAIPSLLRARASANESMAIGDVRTIISAEMAYSSSNGGFFDSLECLNNPTACIPGYPDTAPNFIGADLIPEVKGGFTRTFYPGPFAELNEEQASELSPTSLLSFAYVAVPVEPGVTGMRGFCGDSSGRVCELAAEETPDAGMGVCPTTCTDLQ
jgi:type II secretory pathway pseudopilin PulG